MSRTLWLDSTVAGKLATVKRLCELAVQAGWGVRVHPQIHLEQARSLALSCAQSGISFNSATFNSFLAKYGIPVREFCLDMPTAEAWGRRLAERYPAPGAWNQAKRSALGLAPANARAPMTTDWWVALAAEDDPESVLVTNDQGAEWAPLRGADRVWSDAEAEGHLLGETGAPV